MTWLLVALVVVVIGTIFAWAVFHPFGFGATKPPPPAAPMTQPPKANPPPPKSPPEPPAPLTP